MSPELAGDHYLSHTVTNQINLRVSMIRLYPLPLCYEGYESKSLNPILTYFALNMPIKDNDIYNPRLKTKQPHPYFNNDANFFHPSPL